MKTLPLSRSLNRPHASRNQLHAQHGSIAINAAIAMSLGLVLLIGTELGYLFYVKRELQKTADLAALAGAQALQSDVCSNAYAAANANAQSNLPIGLEGSLALSEVACGHWDPVTVSGPTHFANTKNASNQFDAVQVTIARDVVLLPGLPGNAARTASATATAAKDRPHAVFTVGSKLVETNRTAALTSLLRFVGVDLTKVCAACYDGLATIKVTPGGILSELGIPLDTDLTAGGLDALLAARRVGLGQVLNAIATVAGQDTLANANANLLALMANVGLNVPLVQLGTDTTTNNGVRGLFAQLKTATGSSALNAQVDALDLLTTAVGVATSGHAVNVATGISTLGVTLETRVVEPPSIGIGGVGARAYNAQIRVHAEIDSGSSVLGGLLGALSTKVTLPVTIDVANAMGELTAIDCNASPPTATIQVNAPILSACIGRIDATSLWSQTQACQTHLQNQPLVTLLGAPLLSNSVKVDALEHTESLVLTAGETRTTTRNELEVGETITALVKKLLSGILGKSSVGVTPATRASSPSVAANMADQYLKNATSVDSLKNSLLANKISWPRPYAILLSTTMPEEWATAVTFGCGGKLNSPCARQELINSLQTPAKDGILPGLLKIIGDILGLDPSKKGDPLLSTILSPLFELLEPILDKLGLVISNLLSALVGLDLGRTDVHLQSLSCRNAKLVY